MYYSVSTQYIEHIILLVILCDISVNILYVVIIRAFGGLINIGLSSRKNVPHSQPDVGTELKGINLFQCLIYDHLADTVFAHVFAPTRPTRTYL